MSPTKLFRGVNWFIIQVFGNAKGRTKLDLDLKLGISNIYSSQARDNHYNNHTFNQVEKNFIHGSSSTHDAGVNFNTNQTYEGQASKPGLNFNMATKMEDPKRLRRYMCYYFFRLKYAYCL